MPLRREKKKMSQRKNYYYIQVFHASLHTHIHTWDMQAIIQGYLRLDEPTLKTVLWTIEMLGLDQKVYTRP